MSLPIGNAVHHIAVIGTNYEASRHFYVDVLGFEVVREVWREEKQDWKIDLALDGCELELFILPKAPARAAVNRKEEPHPCCTTRTFITWTMPPPPW